MKLTMILTLAFGFLIFAPTSFVEASSSKKVEKQTKEKAQTIEKKRRRKKVMMCQECGKPETECDCEGEGHGVENHDEHNSEKKN